MRRFLFHLQWGPLFLVPSFCKGPLILYDFWFPNLQKKEFLTVIQISSLKKIRIFIKLAKFYLNFDNYDKFQKVNTGFV